MTNDDAQAKRPSIWPPLLSALLIAGAGYYVYLIGIASTPAFVLLLLVGAIATVLHRLFEMLRAVFDNVVTSALSAITLMLSMIAGPTLIAWVFWMIFSAGSNPVDRLIAAKGLSDQLVIGFTLFIYALLALMGLIHAAALWTIVRTNAFGPKSDA